MRKVIAALAMLAAVSCGDDIEQRFAKASAALPPPPAPAAISTDAASKAGATWLNSWDVATDKKVVVKYEIGPNKYVLKGTPRTEQERDYVLYDGTTPLFIAKSQEDAFRILAPDGAMRWKVKIDGDKIKVSDNDQNANAFVLRTKGQTTTVTAPDGHVLGTVNYTGGKNVIADGNGKTIERMPSKLFRPAYGLLAIDGIAPPERFAMLAELIDLMPTVNTAENPNAVRGTNLQSWNIDGHGVVDVKFAAGIQKHVLHGIPKKAGREYHLDGGPTAAIGVQNAKGFIIRSPGGANRWTVTVDGNTVTLTGGDKDATYEIVTTNGEATVTGPASLALGTVKFEDGNNVMRDAAGDEVDRMPSSSFRAAYGLLLLDGVSPAERYALMAELIDKTR